MVLRVRVRVEESLLMSVPSYRLTLHLPELSVLYLPHLQKPPRKKSNHTMMAQVCLAILDLNK